MKVTPKGSQNTGFHLWDYDVPFPGMSIGSLQRCNSGQWRVDYDATLNGNTLEIVVNGIIPPKGMCSAAMLPATATVFENYTSDKTLSYDKSTKTIKGPQGTKLDIILKDNCSMSKGKQDLYECVL